MQQSSNPSMPTRDKECNLGVSLNKMSTPLCPEMVQQLGSVDGLKFCGKNYSTSPPPPPEAADRCHPSSDRTPISTGISYGHRSAP